MTSLKIRVEWKSQKEFSLIILLNRNILSHQSDSIVILYIVYILYRDSLSKSRFNIIISNNDLITIYMILCAFNQWISSTIDNNLIALLKILLYREFDFEFLLHIFRSTNPFCICSKILCNRTIIKMNFKRFSWL